MGRDTTTDFADELRTVADIAKALGHPARLKIVQILARRESCVCGELVERLPLAQATVSQHLKELKKVGLVRGTISGPRTCYGLDREVLQRTRNDLARFLGSLELPVNEGEDDEGCC